MARITTRWRIFAAVGLLSFLPAFTNQKVAGVQPEDLALVALATLSATKFLSRGFNFRVAALISPLARRYMGLLFALLCCAILAFRFPSFPLDDASVLKSPLLFSASRYIQFAAIVFGFLWLTNTLIHESRRLTQALDVYWWTGIVSCLYGFTSYLLLVGAHVDLLGAYDTDGSIRIRGFFNEGGPFGVYLLSVLIIGLLRRRQTGKRLGFINLALWVSCFLFSQSRAAFFMVVLLFFLFIVAATSFRKRITYLLLGATVILTIMIALDVPTVIAGYVDSYQNLEEKAATIGKFDANLVVGRVAGAYIVPRMVVAHPITGIGIGNYSLMRNDPRYLGNLPDVRWLEDLSGLGLIGDTAELGVPATLFLSFLLLTPYRLCKQKSSILGIAAFFQILAHIMGVHLNFFYPWFVSACAIAAAKDDSPLTCPRRSLPFESGVLS